MSNIWFNELSYNKARIFLSIPEFMYFVKVRNEMIKYNFGTNRSSLSALEKVNTMFN